METVSKCLNVGDLPASQWWTSVHSFCLAACAKARLPAPMFVNLDMVVKAYVRCSLHSNDSSKESHTVSGCSCGVFMFPRCLENMVLYSRPIECCNMTFSYRLICQLVATVECLQQSMYHVPHKMRTYWLLKVDRFSAYAWRQV